MEFLTDGILALTWQQIVMFAVGITLIWLAIKKGFEPALLLPMGFGAILVNLPFSGVLNQTLAGGIQANGVIEWLFHVGIEASEVMPILLFIGIGAMIDFGPLLSNPSLFLFGAGAQLGIFAAILLSKMCIRDSTNACQLYTIFLLYVLCHLLITVLQTGPDIFQTVCPYPILIAVLPLVSAGCDWCIISIYQNCLDSCGTELDSKCCPVIQDCLLCFCCSHV